MEFYPIYFLIIFNHINFFLALIGKYDFLNFYHKIICCFTILLGIVVGIRITRLSEMGILIPMLCLFLLGKRYTDQKCNLSVLLLSIFTILFVSLFRNVLLVVVTDWYMNSSLPIILSFNFWLNLTICFVLEVFIFLNRQRIEETVILFIQAKVSKMILLLSILLLVIAFLISSPDMLFLSILDHNLRDILWSVFIAGSFLLLLLIIWFSFQEKKILVSQFDRQQQEQLQLYLKGLEENQKEIQQFRHDYLNVLLSLEQSIQAKDMEQVEEIYNRIIKPSKAQLNQPSIYYPAIENIQSIEVKSVLFSKVMSASTKNIKVMIDIPDKITIGQVERLDFIRIISIILDNAIEGAELIENSKVIISCFHDQKAIYWIVKNTCSNLEYPLAYYYDEARSSKGENRGIGLVNLQQLIVKYPYLMLDTRFEKGYFVQCLEIITTYAK